MPIRNRFIDFLNAAPLFLFLLPLFFVFHGYARNYNSITIVDAILLLLLYFAASIAIAAVGWLFYRNILKAALFSAIVMAFHFFFGNIQDLLTRISSQGLVSKYRFIIPAFLLIFVLLAILIKKSSAPVIKFNTYL